MDLIYTCYTPTTKHRRRRNAANANDNLPVESPAASICSVSPRNVLLFTTSSQNHLFKTTNQESASVSEFGVENGNNSGGSSVSVAKHSVFVCDLNTPWEVHRVTTAAAEITALNWDEGGTAFVAADAEGSVEVWQMEDDEEGGAITRWRRIFAKNFGRERFIAAKFLTGNKKIFLNNEEMDSVLYMEKFTFAGGSKVGLPFSRRRLLCCVLVSATSMVAAICVNPAAATALVAAAQSAAASGEESPSASLTSSVVTKSLGGRRARILHADIAVLREGKMVIAVSNGNPTHPIGVYSVHPSLRDENGFDLSLDVGNFPSIYLSTSQKSATTADDACLAITGICFVKRDDCDAILVATEHSAGGKVELWELKEAVHPTHKMFSASSATASESGVVVGGAAPSASAGAAAEQLPRITAPIWKSDETFSGPPSRVVSLATPSITLQTGVNAPCFVTVAYADGSIQCLLRDSLQHIGSVDLPKSGYFPDDDSDAAVSALTSSQGSSRKRSRVSVEICSMAFTATGNALVAIDTQGQLYLYRISPISDPGGPHTVPYLVTMFEYCFVSGVDFWDLTICAKMNHIDSLCDKLTENYNRQPTHIQQFYFGHLMAVKATLYRLESPHLGDLKAGDAFALFMLESIKNVLKTSVRSSEKMEDIVDKNQILFERMLNHLTASKKNEADKYTKLIQYVQQKPKEFNLDHGSGSSNQHQMLIQFVTNLALHICASIPDFKVGRKGSGFNLSTNEKALASLRELLLCIRLWSTTNPIFQPGFTKTSDSFDLVAKLFDIITKQGEKAFDEGHNDDCLRLPSQVMIPPLNMLTRARGVSPLAVAAAVANRAPMSFEFSVEPESEAKVTAAAVAAHAHEESVQIEGR